MLASRTALRSFSPKFGSRRRQFQAAYPFRMYHELSFSETGDPAQVLQYRTDESHNGRPAHGPPHDDLVEVHMLGAPWNPADANAVQGVYPWPYPAGAQREWAQSVRQSVLKNSNTMVAGSEGWGRRSDTDEFVTLGRPSLGTLRSTLWLPTRENALITIQRGHELLEQFGPHQPAQLFQVGGTAYRMLHDFVQLQPGDVVLQNAGNSAVGIVLAQLVKALFPGTHMVSVVRKGQRDATQLDELQAHLAPYNDMVLYDEDLANQDYLQRLQNDRLPQLSLAARAPVLAINAVGGDSASRLLRLLAPHGTLVTYGALAQQPVSVPPPRLIFHNVRVVGYWQSRWMATTTTTTASGDKNDARYVMMNQLVDLVLDGALQLPPVHVFPLAGYQDALQFDSSQAQQAVRRKVIFDTAA